MLSSRYLPATCALLAIASLTVTTGALADDQVVAGPLEPAFEHARGFAVEARVPVRHDGGLSVALERASPLMVGYRGARWAALAGPIYARSSIHSACADPSYPCDGPALSRYGAQIHGEVTAIRAASHRAELYLPIEAALASETGDESLANGSTHPTAASGELAWSVSGGAGGRYWLVPAAALFAATALEYRSEVVGATYGLEGQRNQRAVGVSLASTFGLSFVF